MRLALANSKVARRPRNSVLPSYFLLPTAGEPASAEASFFNFSFLGHQDSEAEERQGFHILENLPLWIGGASDAMVACELVALASLTTLQELDWPVKAIWKGRTMLAFRVPY